MDDSDSGPARDDLALIGERRRMATGLFKGVDFQVWQTVLAWMRLKTGELLFVEGAEDFDVVTDKKGVTVQTKATVAPITLRSHAVITSLSNFWRNKSANPDKRILLRFVTTSPIGCEEGRTAAGLDVWKACGRRVDIKAVEDIRRFLLTDRSVSAHLGTPSPLREFLQIAAPEEVQEELIGRVSWECESPDVDSVRDEARREAHAYGQRLGLLPRDSDRVLPALFVRVAHTAFRERRSLSVEDLVREFDEATREAVPKSELTLLRAQATEFQMVRADWPAVEAGDGEENLPRSVKAPLDEAKRLTHEGRYTDARVALESASRAAAESGCEPAILECRIDLAENRILARQDVGTAREELRRYLTQATTPRQKQSILTLLGEAELFISNIAEADSLFREACDIAKRRRDRFGEAHLLSCLANTKELLGDLLEAHRLLDRATELSRAEYREAGPDRKAATAINLGACLASKACLLRHEAKLDEGVAQLTRAEPLLEEAGSLDNLARTKLLRGEILFNAAKWEEGFAVVEEARATFESIGNTEWECRCLDSMAKLFATLGDDSSAAGCWLRAADLCESSGFEHSGAPYLLNLARLAVRNDQYEAAKPLIDRARAAALRAEDDESVAESLVAEATLPRKEGSPADRELLHSAVAHFQAALNECEIKGRRAMYLLKIGGIVGRLGDLTESARSLRQALGLFEEIGDLHGMGECLGSLAAIAREEDSPAEAMAGLERVIELCEGKPLHGLHAGALHDLGMLTLSQGQVAAARKCLDRAKSIADKHRLHDVLKALNESLERLRDAEQFHRPPERDFADLITELHTWCAEFPGARQSILPLWYFAHRAELWAICRSQVGVKFMICAPNAAAFGQTAEALESQGDLFVYARGFAIKTERKTDLIPWPEKFLIPPHIKVAGFKGLGTPEEKGKALIGALRDEAYILVPFDDSVLSHFGTRLCAFGRRMRLPEEVFRFMVETAAELLLARKRICLPLGENKSPGLLHTMLVAWENRMVPIFLRRLPSGDRVAADCDVSLVVPDGTSENPGSEAMKAARKLWLRLASCHGREDLSEVSALFQAQVDANPGAKTMTVRVFVLRFRAGQQEVLYPAVVILRIPPS